MRLSLRHTTTYRFARPVVFNPHRLMLRPRSDVDLDVLSHHLEITPRADVAWGSDVVGNLVATAVFAAPADELVIDSRIEIETLSPEWPVYPIEPHAQRYPFRYSQDEMIGLGALLMANPADAAVAGWAAGFVAGPSTDTLSLLKDLNTGVRDAIGYEAREEENTQSAGETLRRRRGACRDLAELFLACARSLGFGGRAVSGYLIDGNGIGGDDATHAWAEIYVPGPGWIPFDPTNDRMGAAGLVKVAVGHTSAQVLPVVGSYAGEAHDALGLDVKVTTAMSPRPVAGQPFRHGVSAC